MEVGRQGRGRGHRGSAGAGSGDGSSREGGRAANPFEIG